MLAADNAVWRPKPLGIMADDFQRSGSTSNAHVGHQFEEAAISALEVAGISVTGDYPVEIGVSGLTKAHSFDLGSDQPPIIVECKSTRWTSGSNVPSVKLAVWNESMYYFACAPSMFRKIFFVLRDIRATTGQTIAEYYIHTYRHLIPPSVEIWEYDEATKSVEIVHRTKTNDQNNPKAGPSELAAFDCDIVDV